MPDVLLSGHHADVRRVAAEAQALRRTMDRRPDLLDAAALDAEDATSLARRSTRMSCDATRERER